MTLADVSVMLSPTLTLDILAGLRTGLFYSTSLSRSSWFLNLELERLLVTLIILISHFEFWFSDYSLKSLV